MSSAMYGDVRKEFDYQRKRASQGEQANLQQQKDALQRRAAQLGGGPSGALIKQEQVAQDASARRLADVNEGISSAERGEVRRIREVEDARKYQTGEREAAQQFGAQQALLGREFAKSERMGSQEFAALQAEAQRKFQTGERLSSQEFAALQAKNQRSWATGERKSSQRYATGEREASQAYQSLEQKKAREMQQRIMNQQKGLAREQMAQAATQFGMQFNWQQEVDRFNMDMANKMFNEKDPIEKILNPFFPQEDGSYWNKLKTGYNRYAGGGGGGGGGYNPWGNYGGGYSIPGLGGGGGGGGWWG